MKRHHLFLGIVCVSAPALFAVVGLLVMAIALHNDVALLEGRARNAARTEKTLQADIAAIKRNIQLATGTETAPAESAKPAPVAVVPASSVASAAPSARFVKVSAVLPAEYAFHTGDAEGLIAYIKRRQEQMEKTPGNSRYR